MKRNSFKKVIAAMLGGVMALGVGIAVGVNAATSKEAAQVNAAEGDTHDMSISFSKLLNNNAKIDPVTIPAQTYTVAQIKMNVGYNKTAGGVTVTPTIGSTKLAAKTHNAKSTVDLVWTVDPAQQGAITFNFVNNCGSGTGKGTFYVNSVVLTEGVAGETYTVSFNANGGSGTMSDVPDISGKYTLPGNNFTAPSGKAFAGWKANNAGDLIAAGGTYAVSADVTFYAQWVDAYSVTYSVGENGTGSYIHTNQPAGSYTLLPFAELTGVSANSGYRFKNYTVGGVDKDPGDNITLNSATSVTINFEELPLETTYDFTTNFSTYASSWSGYGNHTGLDGVSDIGGDYDATIDLYYASKQTGTQTGTITDRPVFASKTGSGSYTQVIKFTLGESGYKIKQVIVTFKQWGSKTPSVALYKGGTTNGSPIDTATVGTKNTLTTSDLNDTVFSVGYSDGSTSDRVQSGLTSIYITLEKLSSFGTLDHISVTSLPNVIYHVGETYDSTGFAVTAYDGADENTANFKDVTSEVIQLLEDGYTFADSDVPGLDEEVEYTDNGITKSTTYHVYVYALVEYELVTAEPDDWSGSYLIVSTNADSELVAMNGALNNPDLEGNYKTVSETDNVISAGQELEWVITSTGDGYSIQGKSSKYIGSLSTSSNGMVVSTDPVENTISITEDGVTIAGSNGYTLSFNTKGDRFRYYSGTNTIKLYKLKESESTDEAVVDNFVATYITTPGAEDYTTIAEADRQTSCVNKYTAAKAALEALTEEQQALFNSDAKYADAREIYNIWKAAYDAQNGGSGAGMLIFDSKETQNTVLISTLGAAALVAAAGFIFLKKKKA